MNNDYQSTKAIPFSRINSRLHTEALRRSFLGHYKSFGCIEHPPSQITSGIDPTVRFIGSHISVLKPYFNNAAIPERGVSILQDCVRTRNANKIGDPNFYPHWGSFFQSMGALVPYTLIDSYFLHTLRLFAEAWGCPTSDVIVRVSKHDDDLYNVCRSHLPQQQIEIDTKPDQYYRHSIGMPNIVGRNLNFALRNVDTGNYADVGNFIVLEKDSRPHSIEVAIGVSTTIKQMHGLEHVLDCHPIDEIATESPNIRRQLEDIIVTSTALLREGLLPGNQSNKARILKKYVGAIDDLLLLTETTLTELGSIIDRYQYHEYGEVTIPSSRILSNLNIGI